MLPINSCGEVWGRGTLSDSTDWEGEHGRRARTGGGGGWRGGWRGSGRGGARGGGAALRRGAGCSRADALPDRTAGGGRAHRRGDRGGGGGEDQHGGGRGVPLTPPGGR